MTFLSGALVGAALTANRLLADLPAMALGVLIAGVGTLWSLRGLATRLGPEHRLVLWMQRAPGLRLVVGA